MLRIILRNVQYYLLFFSTLLALLAFQRLQYYDQGLLPHPYASWMDRPMHGNGMRYTMSSSPDNAGRIYYGGDESKEIGLFKFKLGLFKFVLPTFSKDDASWERTNELSSLMRVPPPPTPRKRRQSTDNIYTRLRAQTQMHSKNSEERDESKKGKAVKKPSIAYVVVVPHHDVPKLQMPNANKTDEEETTHNENNDRTVYQRAQALSHSIDEAHVNSPYGYQLYALNFLSCASSKNADNGDTKEDHDSLDGLGFKIIEFNADDLDDDGKRVILNTKKKIEDIDELHQSLYGLSTSHEVIVHISLNSILLKPLDNLFDALMEGGSPGKMLGIVDADRDSTKEGKSDKGTKQAVPKSNTTQVDSFTLDLLDSHDDDGGLYIFRSSSQDASISYLKHLQCMSDKYKGKKAGLQGNDSSSARSKLRLSLVARKAQQVSMRSGQSELKEMQCRMQAGKKSLHLDRCLYDVGNFDSILNCSDVNVKDDAKVAYFPNSAAAATDVGVVLEAEGGAPQDHDEAQSHMSCGKPWDCPNLNGCSNQNDHGREEICTWLHSEWFRFVNNKE